MPEPTAEGADAGHQDNEADATEQEAAAPTVCGHPVTDSHGQQVVHVPRDDLRRVVAELRDDGWLQCLDVTAVDYLDYPVPRQLPEEVAPERFEVIVTLISHAERRRIRLRVQVPEEDPTCPTIFDLHPGSEALEREVYDMFGITFTDHPDMTRILMPEDWIGHPLRRDYAIGQIPVQFKGAPTQ